MLQHELYALAYIFIWMIAYDRLNR